MNQDREEIRDGAAFIEDNLIKWVGASVDIDRFIVESRPDVDRNGLDVVIDASGCVIIPGLVNCHHHLYQSLTRAIGTAQGKSLFDWLRYLYPIWAEMTPEAVYVSAKVGLIELVLSGCTTVADHLYLYPNGSKLDDEIRAAAVWLQIGFVIANQTLLKIVFGSLKRFTIRSRSPCCGLAWHLPRSLKLRQI
jgi:cytosine/adenosine deaminase-related metal-dependent hydrolase